MKKLEIHYCSVSNRRVIPMHSLTGVEAFLATVVNNMSSIFTQIVSVQSMRPNDVKTQAQLIEARLKQEISEVQVFDTA
jgi:hypothetical protein